MSSRILKTDFEVINVTTGIVIYTSPVEQIAKNWARDHAGDGPDKRGPLVVHEVVTVEERRAVYRPRPQLALVHAERRDSAA